MKSLKIIRIEDPIAATGPALSSMQGPDYGLILSNMAIAEATLATRTMTPDLSRYYAIVKELQELYNFRFESFDPEDQK